MLFRIFNLPGLTLRVRFVIHAATHNAIHSERNPALVARKDSTDPDRFLIQRGGRYFYHRRVPKAAEDLDERAPFVRLALKTTHVGEARERRDAYERADNEYWASLLSGDEKERSRRRYEAAARRAEALGFHYLPADRVAELPIGDLLARIEKAGSARTAEKQAALLGGVPAPVAKVTDVLDIYCNEIAVDELVTKSEQQRRKWHNIKKRAVARFVEVVGDLDIMELNRDHALKFWRFWAARVAPREGRPSHTPSSANRELGSMRTIYADYFQHLGLMDRSNPFDRLAFAEKAKSKKKRPPFPTAWIREKILAPGALDSLNAEARAILLATIETGARPSETCNLLAQNIRLNVPVPHLEFTERDDPDGPRELKSAASIRVVPLVGVALEVFRRYPDGFDRYREREEALSALINKYLRNNGLTPTPEHTLYGLRHSMEDRMKEAGLGDDLRRMLMGHRVNREEYGIGGGLEWRRSELEKVALPFAPEILNGLPVVPGAL